MRLAGINTDSHHVSRLTVWHSVPLVPAFWSRTGRFLTSSQGRIFSAGDDSAAGLKGWGAEPVGTQDAQPIQKFVTPENAAYLRAKNADTASPGRSAVEQTRWNMMRILSFFLGTFLDQGMKERRWTETVPPTRVPLFQKDKQRLSR